MQSTYNIFYPQIYVLTVVTLYTSQMYTLWDPILYAH